MGNFFSKIRMAFRHPGGRTWRTMEYFDPSWTARIREMAQYVAPGKSVLDLGCGKMWLRRYIRPSAYYPVDYADRGEGTIVCDFNEGQFPPQHADVAFVSGTLEYIRDARKFISDISEHCTECVISYCIAEDHPDLKFRQKQAWVNAFSRQQLIDMFSEAGFGLAAENTAIPNNRIFSFRKQLSSSGN